MKMKTPKMSVVLASLLALESCQHTERPVVQPSVAVLGQHWMHGERLTRVMGQVAGLHNAFPNGLPEDAESPEGKEARQALVDLAAVANALADTATAIPASVENKPMTDTDRRGFVAAAARLHDQAIVLRDAARANQVEPLQGMRDNINSTCLFCHSRYRDISGDLSTHKASVPTSEPNVGVVRLKLEIIARTTN